MSLTTVEIQMPYLVFIGDTSEKASAKTGLGLVEWRRDCVAGQLRFEGNCLSLGVPDMSLEEAVAAGVKSLVIGVAPVGGKIGDHWISALEEAARAGLDIVSGLHRKLETYPGLVAAAEEGKARLINVRVPQADIPIGTGEKRSGKRVLMVGTDCAVGKKYTALALTESLKALGHKATFRATGQTGIMIAGTGVPLDAVVADFISGAAEMISPANDDDHWDVIEGQGSLFNASYAGVSLGLLHGSQPDAIVVCHDPVREYVSSCPTMKVPTIQECMAFTLQCGRLTNPNIRCVGIAINTSGLPQPERLPYLEKVAQETGLPCVDPVLIGCDSIVSFMKRLF